MGEVIELASFTKAPVPAACSGLADHTQDRDAITVDLTDQFVCLVRRMMRFRLLLERRRGILARASRASTSNLSAVGRTRIRWLGADVLTCGRCPRGSRHFGNRFLDQDETASVD